MHGTAIALQSPEYLDTEDIAIDVDIRNLRKEVMERLEREQLSSVLGFKTSQARRKVWSLMDLKQGWDSYDAPPPNKTAIKNALHVLGLLDGATLMSAHIVPSAEGGVGIYFLEGDRYADIECSNDGEYLGVRYVGKEMPTLLDLDSTDNSIRAALQQIRDHVRG